MSSVRVSNTQHNLLSHSLTSFRSFEKLALMLKKVEAFGHEGVESQKHELENIEEKKS
jgi:hypothetical protein